MPNRKYQSSSPYRHGFNGKENDNETVGTGQGTQDYGERIYNPALGKFLSVDPFSKKYPELTPYQFASNRPIDGVDLDGLEWNPAGVISSYAGYDMNNGNQKQQAQQFVHHGIVALKKPSTYENSLLMMRPFLLIAMTVPFGGAGGGLIAEAEFASPAVSTMVESPIVEASVVRQIEKEVVADEVVATKYYRGGQSMEMSAADKKNSVDKVTGLMKEKGISINTNKTDKWVQGKGGAFEINVSTVPQELKIINTKGTHFEIVPKEAQMMKPETYQEFLNRIKLEPTNKAPVVPSGT